MIQVCSSVWKSPWRLEHEMSQFDLYRSQDVSSHKISVCPHELCNSWYTFMHTGFWFLFGWVFWCGFWFFFQEVLISLNKIRYSLVQQQNCVHDVLQWTKIWCYHRLQKSIMYAYFPSLKLKLLMWKMTENCLGVGGVQTGSFGLKMCHLFFLWHRILFK